MEQRRWVLATLVAVFAVLDGGAIWAMPYGVMFERDTDGQSGNELAFITAPTLGDLVDNSNLLTQFSAIEVSAAFSTTGLYSELSSSPPVSGVPEPNSFLLFSVGIVIVVLQLPVARRTRFV